jgi:hypothetical protein
MRYGPCSLFHDSASLFSVLVSWWRLVSDSHEYETMATANGYSLQEEEEEYMVPLVAEPFLLVLGADG